MYNLASLPHKLENACSAMLKRDERVACLATQSIHHCAPNQAVRFHNFSSTVRWLNIILGRMRIVLRSASRSRLLTMPSYKGGKNIENDQRSLLASLKASHEEMTSNASPNCAFFFPPTQFFSVARDRRETIVKTKQWERFPWKSKQHRLQGVATSLKAALPVAMFIANRHPVMCKW